MKPVMEKSLWSIVQYWKTYTVSPMNSGVQIMKNKDSTLHVKLTNVSCASCVKSIEAALQENPAIQEFEVNFASRTVMAKGTLSEEALIQALQAAGYTAYSLSQDEEQEEPEFAYMKVLFRKAGIAGIFGVGFLVTSWLGLHPS